MNRTDSHPSARLPAVRRAACLGSIAALAWALSMPVLAQQMPLTGHMLGNQPDAARATTQKTLQAPAAHTAAPAQAPGARPDATVTPTQPPMPDYTDLRAPLDTSVPSAPAATTPPPTSFGSPIGGTTARLLRMQASNLHAGPARPMLGDEASAAYQRYLQSFRHPIPAFFKTNVETRGNGSGTGTP